MKRKFLEDLGLEKETIDKILDENSADIGKVKGELDTAKNDLKEAQDALCILNRPIFKFWSTIIITF